MGYTNYWNLEKTTFPKEFLEDVKKIIDASIVDIVGWDGKEGTTPIITEEEVSFNGLAPEDYESFYLGSEGGFGFCKTARLPYDEVVKAILIVAEKYGIVSDFSFDGDTTEQEYLTAKLLLKKANISIEGIEESEGEKIKTLLEENGFTVTNLEDGFELQQYTPAGEDWFINLDRLGDIKEFADEFDEEKEFEMWVKADVSGKPSVSELWKDQLWKKELLNKIAEEC